MTLKPDGRAIKRGLTARWKHSSLAERKNGLEYVGWGKKLALLAW